MFVGLRLFLWLLSLLVFCPITSNSFKIGVFVELNKGVPDMWLSHIQEEGGLLGFLPVDIIQYNVDFLNVQHIHIINATTLFINSTVDVVILATLEPNAVQAAIILEKHGIPFILPNSPSRSTYRCDNRLLEPCVRLNTRRFQYGLGISTSAYLYYELFIISLKLNGAKTLAIVHPPGDPFYDMLYGVQDLCHDNGITIVFTFEYTLPKATRHEIINATASLVALQPDAVIYLGNTCANWLTHFYNVDYIPKALCTAACIEYDAATWTDALHGEPGITDDLFQYVSGVSQWDPRLKGVNYNEEPHEAILHWFPPNGTSQSPKQFYNHFIQTQGVEPDFPNAAFSVAFQFIEIAVAGIHTISPLSVTSVINKVKLIEQLQIVYQPSFYGLLSANKFGFNQQKPMAMIQRKGVSPITNEIISPLSSQTDKFTYPMPTWKERVYIHRMFATPIEIGIVTLVIISVMYLVTLVVLTIIHREDKNIRATSFRFSIVMMIGAIVGACSIFTWPFENNSITCQARPWLFTLSFQMFLAPLLAKSYRIATIFGDQFNNIPHAVDDYSVLVRSLLIAFPHILITIIWSTIDPLHEAVQVSDPVRPGYNWTECESRYSIIFLLISISYGFVCIVSAYILAIPVRKAFEQFNDAPYLFAVVYLFSTTALVIAGIQFGFSDGTLFQAEVIFMIRSIGIILSYTLSTSILIVPRLMGICKRKSTNHKRLYLKEGEMKPKVNLVKPSVRSPFSRQQHKSMSQDTIKKLFHLLEQTSSTFNKIHQIIDDDDIKTKEELANSIRNICRQDQSQLYHQKHSQLNSV